MKPEGKPSWLQWAALAAAWVLLIIASGAGWNPFPITWDFSNSGAFGDSFGPLSALMGSLAALAAFSRLKEQRAAALISDEREAKKDKLEKKREFESTFFNFLNFFEKIVAQTDIDRGTSKNLKQGKDAFAFILNRIEEKIRYESTDQETSFRLFFETYINDLAHYFRLLYNIIDFVDKSEVENKYFYVKIVRSIMSDSELCLTALNCVHHNEGINLKFLVEKYCFLNNLSDRSKKFYGLNEKFLESAFAIPQDSVTSPRDSN